MRKGTLMKNWKREQTRNCDGGLLKRYLKKKGKNGKICKRDRRNWRSTADGERREREK